MRDPHIIRSPQGNHFYLIATDLSHTTTLNWGNESKSGSKSIAIYDSDDLVNWSDERLVKVAVDTAGCAWAPESVYDEETGKYMVFWSSLVSEDNYKKHRVYRSYTTDFVTFENPEIWIDNDYSTIDVSVKKIGDRYYRMSKNEESGAKYVYWEYSQTAEESAADNTVPLLGTWMPIHFVKVEKTENGISYKVESTLDDTADIYVALYSKESGVLLSVSKSDEDVFTGISDNQAYRIKAFAWKPGTLEPMCRCIYADITEETTV